MKFVILSVALAGLMLTGCAGHNYCHPGKSESQMNADVRECDHKAEAASKGEDWWGRSSKRGDVKDQCMEARGYTKVGPGGCD